MTQPVMEAVDSRRLRFIGLASDSEPREKLRAYLEERECDLSSEVLLLSPNQLREYRLSITPSTLVVDGRGAVRKVWNGMWTHKDVVEVREILQNGLP